MFNFKKIASALASAAMIGSTVALAAAANYPAPFVSNGNADAAIVYGSHPAATVDLVGAIDLSSGLQTATTTTTSGGTGGSVTGEAYPLFTSSSKLWGNATLNSVHETLTKSELPTVLKDGRFDGDVSSTYEQRITVGSYPQIKFAKQPTDNSNPEYGVGLGTSATTQYTYNDSVVFASVVNFTHADSKNQNLNLFGQTFTVGSATTTTKLVLFKSSNKISMSSDTNPSQTVTIGGKTYTVELVAGTDTSATIKVTGSDGSSDSKEVSEGASKKINGVEIAVDNADENAGSGRITANIIIGASRISLQNGVAVKVGSDEKTMDGTNVVFRDGSGSATNYPGNISTILIQVAANSSDTDAITAGHSYTDPVFGSFKVDFSGLNIPTSSTSDRENIAIQNSGNDRMTVNFMNHQGSAATFSWDYNKTDSTGGGQQLADSDGDSIVVEENALVNKSGYVVLGNEDTGGLFEVTTVSNSSSSTASDDTVTFKNVFTGVSTDTSITSEGTGTVTLLGKAYTVNYYGASTISNSKAMQIRVNSPDTTGNDMILFPSIQTSKGAKLVFYAPLVNAATAAGGNALINLTAFGGTTNANITNFKIPNGNGYTTIAVANAGGNTNFTIGGTNVNTTAAAGASSTTASVGRFTYNFSSSGGTTGQLRVHLMSLGSPAIIVRPAIVLIEKKDNLNNYEGLIAETNAGYDGNTAYLGLTDVERTFGADSGPATNLGDEIQLVTDTNLYEDADYWGSITQLDKSVSAQTKAKISYPSDQVSANVYVAESAATFAGESSNNATTTGGGAIMTVKDTEVSSVSGKNLIVLGGSCVNTVAQRLLGGTGAICGADFTTKTGAGARQYVIQSFTSPYSANKIALLVAGYEADDTKNAATYLRTQPVDTTTGKKYIGTTGTQATLQTTTTTNSS